MYYYPLRFPRLDRDSFEDVKSVHRSGDNRPRNLRVPMRFFDVSLALMNEKKLRGDLLSGCSGIFGSHLFIVKLDTQIPQSNLIICARCNEDGVFCRVPFD
jgi:hypothetical protein